MLKIAHIVNPLVVRDPTSDLAYAQPVTLLTMSRAREQANSTSGLEISQYAAFFAEDLEAVPKDFEPTAVLERSILDVVPNHRSPRKLPFLSDILDRLYENAPQADYLIYSNIDIGVWPDFYQQIAGLICQGYDAFVIARRTLSAEFTAIEDLEHIYAQDGIPHFGYSCFVFARHHYPAYVLGETCIGLQPVGVTLGVNMIQAASRYEYFGRDKLTFHLGDDRVWSQSLLDAQHVHNERTLDAATDVLRMRSKLAPRAEELLNEYQKWRCDYVIDKTPKSLRRNIYRGLRKLGLHGWVAPRYAAFS